MRSPGQVVGNAGLPSRGRRATQAIVVWIETKLPLRNPVVKSRVADMQWHSSRMLMEEYDPYADLLIIINILDFVPVYC